MKSPSLIWYVAYGSNLSRERFLAYLTGGVGPGGSGSHHGARDSSAPRDDRRIRLNRRLIFTGRSKRWGGGVCAVVSEPDREHGVACLGRAWLITSDQLLDVWRQENGGLSTGTVTWSDLDRAGWVDDPEGRYRRLDRLDPIDGRPAVTITCGPEMVAAANRPTTAYLDMVASGLREAWGLSTGDARQYLRHHADGVAGPWHGKA